MDERCGGRFSNCAMAGRDYQNLKQIDFRKPLKVKKGQTVYLAAHSSTCYIYFSNKVNENGRCLKFKDSSSGPKFFWEFVILG